MVIPEKSLPLQPAMGFISACGLQSTHSRHNTENSQPLSGISLTESTFIRKKTEKTVNQNQATTNSTHATHATHATHTTHATHPTHESLDSLVSLEQLKSVSIASHWLVSPCPCSAAILMRSTNKNYSTKCSNFHSVRSGKTRVKP